MNTNQEKEEIKLEEIVVKEEFLSALEPAPGVRKCKNMDGVSTYVLETESPSTSKRRNNAVTDADELRMLLKSWNQEEVAECLLEEHVFVNVLKVMKHHHIGKLLQKFKFGTQILFEHNLEEWRKSIGLPISNNDCTETLFRPCKPPSPAFSVESTESSGLPAQYEPKCLKENTVTLATILNENPRGEIIKEYYRKFGKFEDDQRTALINIIAQYFQEKSIHMSLGCSYVLENEILQIFPNEKLQYYRTNKRGKLYNKFTNLSQSFKTTFTNTLQTNVPKSKVKIPRINIDLVPESDAESYLSSLKSVDLTSVEFDRCWKACTRYRLNDINEMENIDAFFEKWPFYKAPSGYRLIEMDYDAAFGNGNELLNQWESCRGKILDFLRAKNNVKDKTVASLLQSIDAEGFLGNLDAVTLWSLHGYLVPTAKTVKRDVTGKKVTTKFTIKDSQESFLFVGKSAREIEDHLAFLKDGKQPVQPFILCVGENISDITEVYVYFDDIKFQFHDVIRAVDACYKIVYLFNLDFPIECKMFWNFIQSFFFKFSSSTSTKVHVLSEFLRQ